MNITQAFTGTENTAQVKNKLTNILNYYGYEANSYTTWGEARADLNDILVDTTIGTISATEVARTFLPKLNILNDPELLILQETYFAIVNQSNDRIVAQNVQYIRTQQEP